MDRPLQGLTFLLVLALAGCASARRQPATLPPPSGKLTLGLADTALSGGVPSLALQVSEAVLAQHPHDVAAMNRRGDAYFQLGEPAKAAASYRQALLEQPESIPALLGLGRVALSEEPAEAEARFSHVLSIQPRNQAALADRGIASDLTGDHVSAQADYRRAIALGGDVTATEVNLALSLAMSGSPGAAIRILQPIASSPDASVKVREDLAVAFVLAGRSHEAAHLLLGSMSQAQARAAMAAYHQLQPEAPRSPGDPDGG